LVLLLAIVASTAVSLALAFYFSQRILKRLELKLQEAIDTDE
jgi:hypothetical protein